MHSTPLRRRLAAALLVSGGFVFAVSPAAGQPSCPYGLAPDGTCRLDPPDKLPAASGPRYTTLRSEPAWCEIFENGKPLGLTPLKLDAKTLKPGKHMLEARKPGHAPLTFELVVKTAENTTHTIALKGLPVLKLDLALGGTAKDAIVSVDGQQIGKMPILEYFLSTAGKHRIRVEKDGYEPWTVEPEFKLREHDTSEPEPPPLMVDLKPLMGSLSVGTEPGSLVGVPVYVDPDDTNQLGKSIGTTPIDKLRLPVGAHTVVLSIEGLLPMPTTVYVFKDKNASVEAPVPSFNMRPSDAASQSEKALNNAIGKCKSDSDISDACIEAGHLLVHMKKPADVAQAREMYERGCKRSNSHACLALGWLQKQHGQNELAVTNIKRACDIGSDAACYHPFIPADRFPDPTAVSGFIDDGSTDSSRYPIEEGYELAASIGLGPFRGYPTSVDVGGGAWIAVNDVISLGFGLHPLRLRLVNQLEETTGQESWSYQIGPGGDLFALIGNPGSAPVFARIMARATAYWHDTSGVGGYIGIGRLFGNELNHLWEIGAHLETMPLRTHRVAAFGGDAIAEDVVWRPMIVLRYAYLIHD